MKLYKLDRSVLLFKNGACQFLNGLTTNDMHSAQSAFVTIHGRIIATFDQYKIDDDQVVIVVGRNFLQDVLTHLDRYMKLGGIKVEELHGHVYFDLFNELSVEKDDFAILQKKGKLIVTKRELSANVSDDEFLLFRLKNNIPLHGVDYKDEMILNVSETDFVSFTKGCFLGQEPISKVHNRSKPSWKLVVKNEDELSEDEKAKMTSKTIDPDTKRTLGFVFVSYRE